MAAWYDPQGDGESRPSLRERFKAWVDGTEPLPQFDDAAIERVIRGMRDTPLAADDTVEDDDGG